VKITNLSLAAIAAVAMTTGAMADADLKLGGQAVVYYQTLENGGDTDLFSKGNSRANAGLQLNLSSDLGNDFGLGVQGTFLGTLGLENNLVSNTMQTAKEGDLNSQALTKLYLTKKVANTTLKLGRQELPKSLSPLAFSEGWNVFKNTFDAAVVINSDIPDTTVVGAYVSKSNGDLNKERVGLVDLGDFDNLAGSVGNKTIGEMNSGAYMLTVANKSSDVVHPTISYYALKDILGKESGSALWADLQILTPDLPVKLALQGGTIMPENDLEDTTAFGLKVSGKAGPAALTLAYTSVDDGSVGVKNVGTGVKTPLYTQMVFNQNHINTDADTVMLKGVLPAGPGKLITQYAMSSDNSKAGTDYNELDVIYKFKALGTNMLAAYVMGDHDKDDKINIIRLWTRYNF
jgi:hypothetical protein